MNAYKVLDISVPKTIKTQYGDKQKVTVNLRESSTLGLYEAGYFIPKSGLDFVLGDDILADVEVTHDGKYTNLKNVQKMTPPLKVEEKPKESEVPASVWEEKDKRMVRMNALSHSTQIVLHAHREQALSESELAEFAIMVADLLVSWIYDGKCPNSKIPF